MQVLPETLHQKDTQRVFKNTQDGYLQSSVQHNLRAYASLLLLLSSILSNAYSATARVAGCRNVLAFHLINEYIALPDGCSVPDSYTREFRIKPNSSDTGEPVFIQGASGCTTWQIVAACNADCSRIGIEFFTISDILSKPARPESFRSQRSEVSKKLMEKILKQLFFDKYAKNVFVRH